MIYFSIPDGDDNINIVNLGIIQAIREYPEWFYDDFKIDTIYGAPAKCIWNGNKIINGKYTRPITWQEYVHIYIDFGLVYCLTFTNFMLEWKDIFNVYANAIAKELNQLGGRVLLSTELLEKHIRANYPNLQIGWSTYTNYGRGYSEEKQIEKMNQLSENALVRPPYNFNNKFELFGKFKHPENIEFILNDPCIDDCPYRVQHAALNNAYNCYAATPLMEQKVGIPNYCILKEEKNISGRGGEHRHTIHRNMLTKYTNYGFQHFALAGRDEDNHKLFETYLQYFAKPDCYWKVNGYINEFISSLIKKVQQEYKKMAI